MQAGGQLTDDYLVAFCHPRGADGHFLLHFGLEGAAATTAIQACPRRQRPSRVVFSLPTFTAQHIADWNILAPRIGSPGQPGERELKFVMSRMAKTEQNLPPQTSAFDLILWDESPERTSR